MEVEDGNMQTQQCREGEVKWSEVAQSCPTLCDPVDCSLPGSSIHGIFQARVLEWLAIPFSRGSSQPRNPTWVSRTAGGFFTNWAIREAPISKNKNWMRFMTYKSNPHIVKYDGCESWTVKKAEHQRIDAFELWCWRRLLRVPCTARRSNQPILKEINPEYSLEGLMLRLKL